MQQAGVQHPAVTSTQTNELLADVLQLEGTTIGSNPTTNSATPPQQSPLPPPQQQQQQPQQQEQHFLTFTDSFSLDDSYPVSGDPMLSLHSADIDDVVFVRSNVGAEEMIT